jgi:DNA-binding response OmpR family regulator
MMHKPIAFIIEDDAKLGNVFSLALQLVQIDAELIADGKTALTRLNETTPDLIILDLHLPYVSGDEILRVIRANDRLAQVPVILATADSRQADYLQEQAEIVLLKPISPKQLAELAFRLLKKPTSAITG